MRLANDHGFIVKGIGGNGCLETRWINGAPMFFTKMVTPLGLWLIERGIVQWFVDVANPCPQFGSQRLAKACCRQAMKCLGLVAKDIGIHALARNLWAVKQGLQARYL